MKDIKIRIFSTKTGETYKIDDAPSAIFIHYPRESTIKESTGWADFFKGKRSVTIEMANLQPEEDAKVLETDVIYYLHRKGKYYFKLASGAKISITPINKIERMPKYGKYPAKISMI